MQGEGFGHATHDGGVNGKCIRVQDGFVLVVHDRQHTSAWLTEQGDCDPYQASAVDVHVWHLGVLVMSKGLNLKGGSGVSLEGFLPCPRP